MSSTAPELIASRIMICGPDGRPRIELGLVDDEPVMRFFDAAGRECVRLGLAREEDEDPELGGLVAELRLSAGEDGGEASLTASYGGNASVAIRGEMVTAERTAAGAWIEANKRRLEASLFDDVTGPVFGWEQGRLSVTIRQ